MTLLNIITKIFVTLFRLFLPFFFHHVHLSIQLILNILWPFHRSYFMILYDLIENYLILLLAAQASNIASTDGRYQKKEVR